MTVTQLPPVDLTSSNYCEDIASNQSAIQGLAMKNEEEANREVIRYCNFILIILYVFVFLVGIFGNSLVIYVVLRFSKMRTVTNMYIFNLAIADEMFLIGLLFLITTMFYEHWLFGRVLCKIYLLTTSINQVASSILLMVMSFDRFLAVCHPIIAPKYRTPFIAKFICLTIWAVAAILMVPIFMYGDTIESKKNRPTCNIFWPASELAKSVQAFTLYSFMLGFFVPFTLIFVFYILVICRLRRVGPKNKSKEKKRSHRKVTYLVLTVITIYALCWLPYWVGQLYIIFFSQNEKSSPILIILHLFASCLSYANSAVNPVLYAFLSENFQKSFAKAFTCTAKKDVNAQLNAENSIFPRLTKATEKALKLKNNKNSSKMPPGRKESSKCEVSDNNPSTAIEQPASPSECT